MARHYTRVIKRAPRKRWAAHLEQFAIELTNYGGTGIIGGSASSFYTLAVSQSDNTTPTPVIIKTGRYKASLQCSLDLSSSTVQNPFNLLINAYILFVPQGWPVPVGGSSTTYVAQFAQIDRIVKGHPEWLIARRQITAWTQTPGAPQGVYDSKDYIISSKLKRNLNSGDQVMLVLTAEKMTGDSVGSQSFTLKGDGQVTYYTTS